LEQPAARTSPFHSALQSAIAKVEDSQWYDALWTLSLFCNSPDLTPQQQQQLLDWLDPLAAKVIYSTEHLIEPGYTVQRGDTFPEIAARYDVPWQLLANINGVQNPNLLTGGTILKVVRGPFRAEVNLSRNELTLFAGKLYAGRFPITIGNDPAPKPGEYAVVAKQPGRTYYAGNGRTIPVDDPSNPYGKVWIDLGHDLSIHGSPQAGALADGQGCISLSPLDANDVFAILSQGSTVAIRR
jgi:lipoprotein-anchoring transpeptidase ErfK/SrfK